MSIAIHTQITPNPNAWKFILSEDVIAAGKASFDSAEEAMGVPLAAALFGIDHVTQVHFFENVITITQDGAASWRDMEDAVRQTITAGIDAHDPAILTVKEEAKPNRDDLPEDIKKIEEILDRTIRPALQGDGGDLDVVKYEAEKDLLMVRYQGACGTCPSATMGTLYAIQSILQDEFNENIEVIPV
jgi:Fe-S cluster biogenesis protein NfuA